MVLWLTAWHTMPAPIPLAALATVNLSVPNTAADGKYKAQECNNRKPQFSQIVQKPAQLVGSGGQQSSLHIFSQFKCCSNHNTGLLDIFIMYINFSPIRKLSLHMVASSALKCLAKSHLDSKCSQQLQCRFAFPGPQQTPHPPEQTHTHTGTQTHTSPNPTVTQWMDAESKVLRM